MDASWIILGGFCVVMGAILVYVVLMIFWPEWVGITGKTALEAERSHTQEEPSDDSAAVQSKVLPATTIAAKIDSKSESKSDA